MCNSCTGNLLLDHTGEGLLVMEIRRRKDQIESPNWDPFLGGAASANSRKCQSGRARRLPNNASSVFPTNRKETEICAEWKTYVEPELRRLFQTATQTVATDLEQLNGNEKSLANRTLRFLPNMRCLVKRA